MRFSQFKVVGAFFSRTATFHDSMLFGIDFIALFFVAYAGFFLIE